MINETIIQAANQTGVVNAVAQVAAQGFIDLLKEHNMAFVIMAFLGMFAIVSAIGDKLFTSVKFVFLVFIAIPAIIVLGLINKKERKNRLKELGEIKAHLKKHPEKWKIIAYLCLCVGFILFLLFNALTIYLKIFKL